MKVQFLKSHFRYAYFTGSIAELEDNKALELEKEGFVKILKTEKAIKKTTKKVETATKKIN